MGNNNNLNMYYNNKVRLLTNIKRFGKLIIRCNLITRKYKSRKYLNFIVLTKLALFEKKKKTNKVKFFRRTFVYNRRRILYINFKHQLNLFYKPKQRFLKKFWWKKKRRWRKRRYKFLKTFTGKKKRNLLFLTSAYKYFWVRRQVKKISRFWRFFYKKRFFSFNLGFKIRQLILFGKHERLFYVSRHKVFFRKRFFPKRKIKYLVKYRRKIFKREKKKKKLVFYSFRTNLNHWTRKNKYNASRYKHYNFLKRKHRFYLRVQRRRYQYIFRKLHSLKTRLKGRFFHYRPYWYKKGIIIWRLRKPFRKYGSRKRLKKHYLNLLVIKQGLRYYYGNFRLFFLKKIVKQLKNKNLPYKLLTFVLYLENSLFIILYRCNFISHPKIAIYLMRDNHDIFYINSQYVHYPLYQVKVGDLIGIKNRILQKMLNRFLRAKKIPSFLYVNFFLGIGWLIRKPELRDYDYLQVLPLKSLRYLVSNLKYLV